MALESLAYAKTVCNFLLSLSVALVEELSVSSPFGLCNLSSGFENAQTRRVPVVEESLEADVRERMLEEHLQNLVGHGRDVRAGLDRLDDVQRMADAGDEHFALEAVVLDHVHGVGDGAHTVVRDVVDSTDEVGNERRARFGGHQGLRDGEDERHVRADALIAQGLDQADARLDERDLDHDLRMPARDLESFLEHRVVIRRDDFGANRAARNEFANLEHRFAEALAGLRDKGGIGGYAVDDAPLGGLAYFFDVAGIDE